MFKQLTALTLLAGLILSQPVMAQENDGPFGIYMGMPLEEMNINRIGSVDPLWVLTVPDPSPYFQIYQVWGTPEAGACSITAIGMFENEGEFKAGEISFLEELNQAYGPYKIEPDPDISENWIIGSRTFTNFYWPYNEVASEVTSGEDVRDKMTPNGVRRIDGYFIVSKMLTLETFSLSVTYYFENENSCREVGAPAPDTEPSIPR